MKAVVVWRNIDISLTCSTANFGRFNIRIRGGDIQYDLARVARLRLLSYVGEFYISESVDRSRWRAPFINKTTIKTSRFRPITYSLCVHLDCI